MQYRLPAPDAGRPVEIDAVVLFRQLIIIIDRPFRVVRPDELRHRVREISVALLALPQFFLGPRAFEPHPEPARKLADELDFVLAPAMRFAMLDGEHEARFAVAQIRRVDLRQNLVRLVFFGESGGPAVAADVVDGDRPPLSKFFDELRAHKIPEFEFAARAADIVGFGGVVNEGEPRRRFDDLGEGDAADLHVSLDFLAGAARDLRRLGQVRQFVGQFGEKAGVVLAPAAVGDVDVSADAAHGAARLSVALENAAAAHANPANLAVGARDALFDLELVDSVGRERGVDAREHVLFVIRVKMRLHLAESQLFGFAPAVHRPSDRVGFDPVRFEIDDESARLRDVEREPQTRLRFAQTGLGLFGVRDVAHERVKTAHLAAFVAVGNVVDVDVFLKIVAVRHPAFENQFLAV